MEEAAHIKNDTYVHVLNYIEREKEIVKASMCTRDRIKSGVRGGERVAFFEQS